MINRLVVKIFSYIHNFSYKVISFFAIRENNNIHPKHQIINYHEFFVSRVAPSDTVLDIGCGNGEVAFDLARKASRVTAIDIEAKNIAKAKKRFSANNLEYIVGDATQYDFQKNFDIIILSNVLEHIERRTDFLERIKPLAPKLLIRVPLLTRDWLAVYKKNNDLEYRLDSTHFTEYTEEEFAKEMAEAGFEVKNFFTKFGELYCVATKPLD